MERIVYVQRLNKPYGKSNPFSFGGGYINGGLSDEAMDILNQIFSFDYMGSAEFEWGAVPTALTSLVDLRNDGKITNYILDDKVYVICPQAIKEELNEWLRECMKDEPNPRLKEYLGLERSLKQDEPRTLGWLKIEEDKRCKEPFMFFVNKEMYENVCKLLELDV